MAHADDGGAGAGMEGPREGMRPNGKTSIMNAPHKSLALACAAVLALSAPKADAAFVTAFEDSIIQPGGPRTGGGGTTLVDYFFNAEGSGNGRNASFAVADFSGLRLGISSLSQLGQLQLRLTEDNAGFTRPGPIAVYLSTDTTTNIGLGTPLTFQAQNTPTGLGTQLNNAVGNQLGTFGFTATGSTGSGTVDTIDLTRGLSSLSMAAQTSLLTALDNGGTIRLVVASADPSGTVAATFAGINNTDPSFATAGPALVATAASSAVPEPSSLILVGLGIAGMASAARRRAARVA